MEELDDEELVDRVVSDFGGMKIVTKEKRSSASFRISYARRLAILSRLWIEGYERRLPPLERRSWRQSEDFAEHMHRVYDVVGKLVMKADPFWGMKEDWQKAVERVGTLSYEECLEEMKTFTP